MKSLILVPTYNERENIQPLMKAVLDVNPEVHILVIDDSSPDGTGELVKAEAAKDPRIHLLSRAQKQGLGRAYIAGFKWGLEKNYDTLVEMDADFSHRPEDLKLILAKFQPGVDFVIGSRYVPGGRTVNWGLLRKIISRGGSLYSRLILGYPVNDWTGGFNAWTRRALDVIQLDRVTSNGYSFQIELKYRALRGGCKGVESPIVFEDRRVGQSKMSLNIVLEAFYKVWQIRWSST
ncbi:MAG: polyprenol monophosphomannose synthase [Bdellovibrionaceae bacterium]|nr:polyprenol monophosphomannose synthase [Pseudobdellovibrionaceae bacterium]